MRRINTIFIRPYITRCLHLISFKMSMGDIGYGYENSSRQGDRLLHCSLWDTYRATHPLYTIIDQDRTNHFIRTFINKYEEGGIMPFGIWLLTIQIR